MIPTNSSNTKQVICNYLELSKDAETSEDCKFFAAEIDSRIFKLVKEARLGELDINFLKRLSKEYFENKNFCYYTEIKFWRIYEKINNYIQIDEKEKPLFLTDLKTEFLELKKMVFKNSGLDKLFIVSLYKSNCNELIELFCKIFPAPPISIFDPSEVPDAIAQESIQRKHTVTLFYKSHVNDPLLEKKVTYLQRHIRAKIRTRSEIDRIKTRYFKNSLTTQANDAKKVIRDANLPYIPQKCSPELRIRILEKVFQIDKLYPSVSHLLDASKAAQILECLFGRQNLNDLFLAYRDAALSKIDTDNGDSNVICLGPDQIDPICLKGRTIGLELDIDMLTSYQEGYNKNPAIFFKQNDLGYFISSKQSITVKDMQLIFTHAESPSSKLKHPTENASALLLYPCQEATYISHYAEIWKDRLISSNVRQMHQILVLNFFRFLDQLKEPGSPSFSPMIEKVYHQISQMNDAELRDFLLNLGKKMSCSSEFNIYGAHRLDLNALLSITIYNNKQKMDCFKINDLYTQLNNQNFEILNALEERVPEIFSSSRFIDHVASKIQNSAALEKWNDFIQKQREK